MFYLYQGLYDFIQSRPGIREFHSTILRFIVLIHSTFFREGHTLDVVLPLLHVALLPVTRLNFACVGNLSEMSNFAV